MTDGMPAEEAALARLLATDVGLGLRTAYGDDADQVWETWGSSDAPAVVLVHGGYFRPAIDRSHARPMAAALASAGYRVVLAEYRRRPGEPDASVADLAALDAHLQAGGIAPVAWIGHSAGGTLVLLQGLLSKAGEARAPRIVALAPVSDLVRAAREGLGDGAVVAWLGGPPGEVAAYERLDPARLLRAGRRCAGDLVLLHGTADETVPPEHTRALPVPPTLLAGAHHFDVVDPDSPHFAAVLAALPPVGSRSVRQQLADPAERPGHLDERGAQG